MVSSANIESILNLTKFSTLSTLIGVTGKVLRAVQRFKSLKKIRPTDMPVNAVKVALEPELLWVRSAQKVLLDLKTQTKQFNLFKDENGIWHCHGRLANTDMPYEVKFPILLLRSHSLTSLVVKKLIK